MGKQLTTEEFVEKAQAKHGNRYDYSRVEYVNSNNKVKIGCAIHGVFEQVASYHLTGNGCFECSRHSRGDTRRYSTEEFINRAKAVHGDKYDYSQIEYVGSMKKVKIICLLHGAFIQKPAMHLKGNGCAYCGGVGRMCTVSFIARAKEIHGDRYDYSQVDYVNNRHKVKIGCAVHGVFEQPPHDHLQGCGCLPCSNKENGRNRAMGTTGFIARAKNVHGNKYDYSLVEYVNSANKITIGCPEHGKFEQIPWVHLTSVGCPKCGYRQTGQVLLSSNEHFIKRSHATHGDRYDYSQTRYTGRQNKVQIRCPEHGVFEQSPGNHINGAGCPSCGRDRTGMGIKGWWLTYIKSPRVRKGLLYFIRIFNKKESFFKIGITINSLSVRYSGKRLHAEYEYEVVALYTSFDLEAVYEWEQSILTTFSYLKYRPRIAFPGETECFSEAEPILAAMPIGTRFLI